MQSPVVDGRENSLSSAELNPTRGQNPGPAVIFCPWVEVGKERGLGKGVGFSCLARPRGPIVGRAGDSAWKAGSCRHWWPLELHSAGHRGPARLMRRRLDWEMAFLRQERKGKKETDALASGGPLV